jgi:hypothetical protein
MSTPAAIGAVMLTMGSFFIGVCARQRAIDGFWIACLAVLAGINLFALSPD